MRRELCGGFCNFLHEAWVQHVIQNAFPAFTLGFPSVNCGAVSDKHGKHFHHDISVMENRYKGKWGTALFADYYLMVKRGALEIQYR
jgi:hypothetical protein